MPVMQANTCWLHARGRKKLMLVLDRAFFGRQYDTACLIVHRRPRTMQSRCSANIHLGRLRAAALMAVCLGTPQQARSLWPQPTDGHTQGVQYIWVHSGLHSRAKRRSRASPQSYHAADITSTTRETYIRVHIASRQNPDGHWPPRNALYKGPCPTPLLPRVRVQSTIYGSDQQDTKHASNIRHANDFSKADIWV